MKPLVEVRKLAPDAQLLKSQCVLIVAQRLRAGHSPQQHTYAADRVRKRIADHVRAGALSMSQQHPQRFEWRPFASWVVAQDDWNRQARFDDIRASLHLHTRTGTVSVTLGDATVNAVASATATSLDAESATFIKRMQHELAESNRDRADLQREITLLRSKLDRAERIAGVRQQKVAGGRKGGKAGKGVSKTGNF
ncbi:hypothetical protein LK996_00700 [Lysobacter sp. A6]|uniref:KfrA N-terminal DNA-binding domain-containing protein n=1 Tax=Noviluteimonas lactosilytica TaxID=2888523 RepID=A0ABS8JDC6_9GAMM|nr:hypothetical protein [Lysobacter lactosilyticus]MCC8361602.1 hypothetical protein [Lysobacter lactosilyticus]